MNRDINNESASVSRQRRGFTVGASPFNGVKLDLGILLVIGGLLWLVHDRLIGAPLGQLALLSGYGLVAMGWIIYKTRRVIRSLAAEDRQNNGA